MTDADADLGSARAEPCLVGRGPDGLHRVDPMAGYGDKGDAVPLGVAAESWPAEQRGWQPHEHAPAAACRSRRAVGAAHCTYGVRRQPQCSRRKRWRRRQQYKR